MGDRIAQILGVPEVDSAVDCVGFEARAHGKDAEEAPATVLNSLMAVARAGGAIGIPGLYVTDDPGAKDENAKERGARDSNWPGLGQVTHLCYRPVPSHALSPPAHDGNPAR